MDMNEIKEIFFQECEEQLAELESGLLRLNDGDTDPETVPDQVLLNNRDPS